MYAILLSAGRIGSQTVSPVIAEYKNTAQGRIALTNDALVPMIVVLEAQSFSVAPNGDGIYRPLDSMIHVEVSSKSARVDPGETYYVFYKARADTLPAWFTIYSAFSPAKSKPGVSVRILLPHTVYIYPRHHKSKGNDVETIEATYSKESGKIVCEIANKTGDLERVEEVRVVSKSYSLMSPGFPLLPGTKRRVELEWKEREAPREFVLRMHRSTVSIRLSTIS